MPVIDSSKGQVIQEADTNKAFPMGQAPWDSTSYGTTSNANMRSATAPMQSASPPNPGGLNDFLALVRTKGLASHNHYYLAIDIPRCLQGKYAQYGQTISLLCAGGEFPAVSMLTKDIFWQGATRPVATGVNYNDCFYFFYIEQNMELKSFFDDWFRCIYNSETGVTGFPDDYSTQIRTYQLDRMFVPTYGIQFENIFPKASFPLQVTAQGGALHRLPISFNYRRWVNIEVQYTPDTQNSFWGNLLSSQGAQILNKVAPVLYGILA
jgi:hypothetical protein